MPGALQIIATAQWHRNLPLDQRSDKRATPLTAYGRMRPDGIGQEFTSGPFTPQTTIEQ